MQPLVIYHFDSLVGAYLGKGIADENPLDRENPLIPFGATTVEPPEELEGHVRVFDGTQWNQFKIPSEEPAEPLVSSEDI